MIECVYIRTSARPQHVAVSQLAPTSNANNDRNDLSLLMSEEDEPHVDMPETEVVRSNGNGARAMRYNDIVSHVTDDIEKRRRYDPVNTDLHRNISPDPANRVPLNLPSPPASSAPRSAAAPPPPLNQVFGDVIDDSDHDDDSSIAEQPVRDDEDDEDGVLPFGADGLVEDVIDVEEVVLVREPPNQGLNPTTVEELIDKFERYKEKLSSRRVNTTDANGERVESNAFDAKYTHLRNVGYQDNDYAPFETFAEFGLALIKYYADLSNETMDLICRVLRHPDFKTKDVPRVM